MRVDISIDLRYKREIKRALERQLERCTTCCAIAVISSISATADAFTFEYSRVLHKSSVIKQWRPHTWRACTHFLFCLYFSKPDPLSCLFLLLFLHINFPSKCLSNKSRAQLHSARRTCEAEIIDIYSYNNTFPRSMPYLTRLVAVSFLLFSSRLLRLLCFSRNFSCPSRTCVACTSRSQLREKRSNA